VGCADDFGHFVQTTSENDSSSAVCATGGGPAYGRPAFTAYTNKFGPTIFGGLSLAPNSDCSRVGSVFRWGLLALITVGWGAMRRQARVRSPSREPVDRWDMKMVRDEAFET
jgi:hypothetical protein